MEANEANKSKFTYPDKLYARTFNGSTLDIGYAPQDMEAYTYTRTDVFFEKTCNWLIEHLYEDEGTPWIDIKWLIRDLKIIMEE